MGFMAIGAGKNVVLVRIVIRGFQGSIDWGSTCWIVIGTLSPPPMGIAVYTPVNCTKRPSAEPVRICICLGTGNPILVTVQAEVIKIRKIGAIRGSVTGRLIRNLPAIGAAVSVVWGLIAVVQIITDHFVVQGSDCRLIPPLVSGIAAPVDNPSDSRLNPTKRMGFDPSVLLSEVLVMTGKTSIVIRSEPGSAINKPGLHPMKVVR
jgi:hypothetical protein